MVSERGGKERWCQREGERNMVPEGEREVDVDVRERNRKR
jgi:hypothetical protein